MDRPTFSQTWDRIGPLRPRLRGGVHIARRVFRRRRGYVVHDPASNQFFRLDPVSYHLLALLDGTRTVDEAWGLTTDKFGDASPTQNEVVGLLSQLYQVNLVTLDGVVDADQLFKRMRRRQNEKAKRQAMNFLFLKIPLFDPSVALDWLLPLVRPLLSVWGFVAWLALLAVGAAQIVMHWSEFRYGVGNLLRPGNLVWVVIVFVIVKAVHEFAHGLTCRRFGGQVHEMGIMLLLFAPVPYCDATSSWGLANRVQRAMVGMAGIIVELGVAAIAAIVWANTADGDLHELAYNTIFVTGIASLVFNANPLLRYDGYYVLSDLLDIPNLYQCANRQIVYLVQHYLFGLEQVRPVAKGVKEPAWLLAYAVASWVYRVLVFVGIFWFLSSRYLGLGLALAAMALVGWVLVPIAKFARWLLVDPALAGHRLRPVLVTAALALAAFVGTGLIRVDEHTRAEAVMENPQWMELVAAADGYVDAVAVRDGQDVREGDVLLRATNPALVADRQGFEAQRIELEVMLSEGSVDDPVKSRVVRARLESVKKQIAELDRQIENLSLRSPMTGRIVAPQVEGFVGRYVRRGDVLGVIRVPESLRATAIIDQSQNAMFFEEGGVRSVELRTAGRPNRTIAGRVESIGPAPPTDLPTPLRLNLEPEQVAAARGAPSAAPARSGERSRAEEAALVRPERFFRVRIAVDDPLDLYAGQRAVVRFTHPKRPLLEQWWRDLLRTVRVRIG